MRSSSLANPGVVIVVAVAAFFFSVAANAVDADAAKALAKQNNCFRCHGIDKDKDGPAWQKIAAKYKSLPDAEAKLTHHLTVGGKVKFSDGHEQDHVVIKSGDASEIKNLVDWILSL